jgi:hypothetical protein
MFYDLTAKSFVYIMCPSWLISLAPIHWATTITHTNLSPLPPSSCVVFASCSAVHCCHCLMPRMLCHVLSFGWLLVVFRRLSLPLCHRVLLHCHHAMLRCVLSFNAPSIVVFITSLVLSCLALVLHCTPPRILPWKLVRL